MLKHLFIGFEFFRTEELYDEDGEKDTAERNCFI